MSLATLDNAKVGQVRGMFGTPNQPQPAFDRAYAMFFPAVSGGEGGQVLKLKEAAHNKDKTVRLVRKQADWVMGRIMSVAPVRPNGVRQRHPHGFRVGVGAGRSGSDAGGAHELQAHMASLRHWRHNPG